MRASDCCRFCRRRRPKPASRCSTPTAALPHPQRQTVSRVLGRCLSVCELGRCWLLVHSLVHQLVLEDHCQRTRRAASRGPTSPLPLPLRSPRPPALGGSQRPRHSTHRLVNRHSAVAPTYVSMPCCSCEGHPTQPGAQNGSFRPGSCLPSLSRGLGLKTRVMTRVMTRVKMRVKMRLKTRAFVLPALQPVRECRSASASLI